MTSDRAQLTSIAVATIVAIGAASGAVAVASGWSRPAMPSLAGDRTATAAREPRTPPPVAPAAVPPPPAPAPPPQPAPAPTRAPCASAVSLHFAYGRDVAPDDTGDQLAAIATYAAAHADAKVFVDGHADPTGDELGNLVLSKRRARHVADVLAAHGVSPDRVIVRAFGAYVPVAGEEADGQRRVRVFVRAASCGEEEGP